MRKYCMICATIFVCGNMISSPQALGFEPDALWGEMLPIITETAEAFGIDPIVFHALAAVETGFRWLYGDEGQSVGFLQIYFPTAKWMIERGMFEMYLQDQEIDVSKLKSPQDMYDNPVETTVLSILYFVYVYRLEGSVFRAASRYNGEILFGDYYNRFAKYFIDLQT